jgi:hypothetical protein
MLLIACVLGLDSWRRCQHLIHASASQAHAVGQLKNSLLTADGSTCLPRNAHLLGCSIVGNATEYSGILIYDDGRVRSTACVVDA